MLPFCFCPNRNLASEKIRNQNINEEVIGRTASGETHLLAELKGTMWSIMNSGWLLQIKKTPDEDEHYFELTGTRKVSFLFIIDIEFVQEMHSFEVQYSMLILSPNMCLCSFAGDYFSR